MQAKNHPSYKEEQEHLQETLDWIEEEKEFLESYEEILKSEIAEIRKTVTTLMDERLIAKQQLHGIATKDVGSLKKAKENPYFGRIDFQENRRDEIENIYIGKNGLLDKEKEIPIVVDWRAPIADIYYSGHSKDVSYRAPDGEIAGTMYLKRRYEIREGELEEIFDDKTSEDVIEDSLKGKGEFLTEALNKTTQGRLKEIVATIQDQQNKIIRSEMIKPLVVQGVAGSGKTTIALHRMAYLIYNNRRNMDTANYMVIAPNKLFLNYISDILPDLGVDNVVQTTFEDWALQLINKKIKMTQGIDKLNLLMNRENERAKRVSLASKIKGSLLFKKVIDNLIKKLEKSILSKEDLAIEDTLLLSYDKVQEIFLTSNIHLSMEQRVKKMKEYLKIRLKKEIPEIQARIENSYRLKIEALKRGTEDIEAVRKDIIKLYDKRDEKIAQLKQNLSLAVDVYMAKVEKLNTLKFYVEIFTQGDELEKAFASKIQTEDFTKVCEEITSQLVQEIYENEDLAALAYIHIKLFGLEEKNKYSHIVVDEAQDLDEFKMSILRELSMNDSFTFVGDLSQGIYAYRGINSWKKTMERVFKEKDYNYHLLTTSYRSTIEIVDLANAVIRRCEDLKAVLAEPIFRHGEKPKLKKCFNHEEMLQSVVEKIKKLSKENAGSMAVICKDLETTKRIYSELSKGVEDIHLITDEVTNYHGGIVVIPSYLSKGLEFDEVILWDVSKENYRLDPMEVKLLYIGITRALHKVFMVYHGEISAVLEGLEDVYELGQE